MVKITFPPCLCSPLQTSTSHTRISSFPFSLADGGSFATTSSLSSSSGGYCTATSTWSAEEIRSPGPREKAALVNPSSLPSSPPPPAALLLLLPLLMQSSSLLLLLLEVEAPPVAVSLDERRLFSRHHQKSCEHAFTTRPSCLRSLPLDRLLRNSIFCPPPFLSRAGQRISRSKGPFRSCLLICSTSPVI